MNIIEILKIRGFNENSKTKLVRHLDNREKKKYDVYELMTSGLIETYQSCQSQPILDCEYMVSFIGYPYGRARFIGLYKINGRTKVSEVTLPENYPIEESPNNYFYFLEKEKGYEDLEERIIIDWGQSKRAWHQWLKPKEVVEILPRGYTRSFPDYLDFILTFDELKKIVSFPEANREWHTKLSSVGGIYLILQSENGHQYIGSAYGPDGILGRWKNYVSNGHGGNKLLENLCRENPLIFKKFKFSILRTLPKSLTSKEVIQYESFYKEKLGTRAFGLNAN